MKQGNKQAYRGSIVKPQDASAIILLRKIPDGKNFEVLMVKKHKDMKFGGGTYVFPGGKVDPLDYDPRVEKICAGLTFEKACAILKESSHSSISLGYWVTAIRELFEETGILFAYDENDSIVRLSDRFLSYRRRVQQKQISMLDMILEEGLRLATDLIFYFAHWITPEISPIRYSTRFFVAELPGEQVYCHGDGEIVASIWITPEEAMERYKIGDFPLMFPVFHNLKSLSEFSTIEELIESTKTKEIKAILPKLIEQDGKNILVLPGDPRY